MNPIEIGFSKLILSCKNFSIIKIKVDFEIPNNIILKAFQMMLFKRVAAKFIVYNVSEYRISYRQSPSVNLDCIFLNRPGLAI